MSDIVKTNGNAIAETPVYNLTQEQINTLVSANVIPKGTPEANIKLFAQVCKEKGLSPFSRQIHLIPRYSQDKGTTYTIQAGIDGFRAIADRSNKYGGSDEYLFDEGLTEYQMLKAGRKKPTTATATVLKVVSNVMVPTKATARWEEYYPGEKQGFMWNKMPFLMLGKCAEALALRKAFPEALSGLYTDEEMQQAENIKYEPKQEPKEANPEDAKYANAPEADVIPLSDAPKSVQQSVKGEAPKGESPLDKAKEYVAEGFKWKTQKAYKPDFTIYLNNDAKESKKVTFDAKGFEDFQAWYRNNTESKTVVNDYVPPKDNSDLPF
jgi:phage recombination protein Bet